MAIRPVVGMLRRNLITDIGVSLAIGVAMGNVYWYGFHMPRTHARDDFYRAIEEDRANKRV
ncbi:hypothetical protein VPNG_07750 [Cytospora leucostoma]|uniref:Cytochrome c oxidase subunit 9, mitochondrial n=1 Tax=Cytospora leucostoma TaxID=1230097 RepID=A0A423W8F7_9PEZI|nr:hypothetical protein VPNG_07750 [Cytospora leucostoma]